MHERFDWLEVGNRVIIRTVQENNLLTEEPRQDKPVLNSIQTVRVATGIVIYCDKNKIQVILEFDLSTDKEERIFSYHDHHRTELKEINIEDTLELAIDQPCPHELLTHWSLFVRRILQY